MKNVLLNFTYSYGLVRIRLSALYVDEAQRSFAMRLKQPPVRRQLRKVRAEIVVVVSSPPKVSKQPSKGVAAMATRFKERGMKMPRTMRRG